MTSNDFFRTYKTTEKDTSILFASTRRSALWPDTLRKSTTTTTPPKLPGRDISSPSQR